MKFLAIVLMATAAASGYGILHDQVVLRLCVESLGSGHPPAIDVHDPRLAALARNALDTCWLGALQGLLLALAARAGRRPKLGPLALVLPMGWTLLASAASGVAGGALGAWLAERGIIELAGELAERVPASEHVEHLAALWVSGASLLGSAIAGLTVAARTWKRRGRQRGASNQRARSRSA